MHAKEIEYELNGKLKIKKELHKRERSSIFEATIVDSQTPVILKTEKKGGATSKSKLINEISILEQLKHPNIVQMIAHKETHSNVYLILEYLNGTQLTEHTKHNVGLDFLQVEKICLQLCDALEMSHDLGILHLDIKPSNVMSTWSELFESYKLIDFGISTEMFEKKKASLPPWGTPGFVSPEQIFSSDKQVQIDRRADIYSVGCLMGFLLNGAGIFKGNTQSQILKSQLEQNISISDGSYLMKAPHQVKDIVIKCTEVDPSKRYQDIFELSDVIIEAASCLENL